MSGVDWRRKILFGAVALILVCCGIALSLGGNDLAKAPEAGTADVLGGEEPSLGAGSTEDEKRITGEVETAARGFLGAFLRYEVGQLSPAVARGLRASATPSFASELLMQPPGRAAPRMRVEARLGSIEVTFLSAVPPQALITGIAHRGGFSERFSFVLERRGLAWLAKEAGG